eukprot:6192813-Pleurochrysis_carterae.AAC.1
MGCRTSRADSCMTALQLAAGTCGRHPIAVARLRQRNCSAARCAAAFAERSSSAEDASVA